MPYCRIYYHIVWTTKHRLPLLVGNVRDVVYKVIISKVHELGGLAYAINGMPDHIHLVVAIPPRIAVADFVRIIKGASSYHVSRLETATEASTTEFAWQREYGVTTVSEARLATVARYVDRQQGHHAPGARVLTDFERIADDSR